jgi:hypothetical protein
MDKSKQQYMNITKNLYAIEGQTSFIVCINEEVVGTVNNKVDAKLAVKALGNDELCFLKKKLDEKWSRINVEIADDSSSYKIFTTQIGYFSNGIKKECVNVSYKQVPHLFYGKKYEKKRNAGTADQ